MWRKAIEIVDVIRGWLSNNAWVIVQIHPKEYQDLSLESLEKIDERKYGSTLLVFYEKS